MDKNDIDRTTAQQQKHFRIVHIHAKFTRMLTAGTRSTLGRTVELTFLLLLGDITPAFAPRDAIVTSVSNQGAGFG